MTTKFRRFMAYLMVLMLICSDLAVPVPAEEIAPPVTEPAASAGTLTLPAALQVIEEEAFCGNTSISRVVVPEGTTTIESRAFADSSLTEIVLSSTLTSIADSAFDGCGEFAVSAPEGSYAYEWAAEKGYIKKAFTTEVLEDGTLAITGYTGTDVDIVIPAEIGGVQVTKIGRSAFEKNTDIASVTLPEGLASIDDSAFFACYALKSVVFPDTLTHIGYAAFASCISLDNIIMPDSVTEMENHAFSGCTALSSIKLSNGLSKISNQAFVNCINLTGIEIPAGITFIDNYAFNGCTSLIAIELPDDITSIGNGSFKDCLALASINLPNALTSIGEQAFSGCEALTATVVSGSYAEKYCISNNISYESTASATPAEYFTTEVLDDGTLSITGYTGYDADVVIPAQIRGVQVTKIGSRAFYGNLNLNSVAIPEGVTVIGEYAFSIARNMTAAELPSTLITIEKGAFNQCNSLKGISLPAGLTTLGQSAFNGNYSLSQVTIPASLTSIGSYAFWQCYALESFIVSGGNPAYQAVDGVLFSADGSRLIAYPVGSSRTAYTVPAGVTTIGEAAFRSSPLTSVTLNEGVTTLENWAFGDNRSLISVSIPASLTTIGNYAFNSCDNMSEFNVAEGNTVYESIDGVLFSKADKTLLTYPLGNPRTAYDVPEGTLSIADDAFSDSNLTSLTLPDSLTAIGDHAFTRSDALGNIQIPAGVTTIEEGAFRCCYSMTAITVSDENTAFKDVNGVLFSKDGSFLHSYPAGKNAASYTVPDGVLEIGPLAFIEVNNLTSVTLPEGLTTISDAAFNMCYNLASINIPESVSYIDTFYSCDNLVPTVVEGSYGQTWCEENGVEYEFEGATYIESSHPYEDSADQTWEYTHPEEAYALALTFSSNTRFENNWDALTVTDAEGTATRYTGSSLSDKTIAVLGNSFTLRLTSDESVNYYGFRITKIEVLSEEEYESFMGFQTETLSNGTLTITGYNGPETELEIPAEINGIAVTAISDDAFRGSALTSIVIPEGVARIGSYAFSYCSDLTSVSLPQSLRVIDRQAFEECAGLSSVVLPDGLTSLGTGAFEWCYNLNSVNIPAGLTSISASAFIGCENLTELVIPEGVKSIGDYAFAECYSLTSASLPASLTSIDNNAFNYSNNLIITAPEGSYAWQWAYGNNYLDIALIESDHPYEAGVTRTWEYTADSADVYALAVTFSRRTEFIYDDCLIVIDADGAQQSFMHSELSGKTIVLFGNSFSLKLVSITGGQYGFAVTKIEELSEEDYFSYGGFTYQQWGNDTVAITGYTGLLTEIEIPSEIDDYSVVAIGDDAFSDNDRLIRVVIPEGVTEIGAGAFENCDSLAEIVIPEGVMYIGTVAFRDCANLTSLVLPQSLNETGWEVFCGCTQLADIVIPEGVTYIGDGAFYRCENLTEVTIPEGITELTGYFFGECSRLKTVHLPASITFIEDDAFSGSDNVIIYAPEGSYAYEWAESHSMLPEVIIIESEHPYAPNTDQTWEYVHPEEAYALAVTFGMDTNLEHGCDYLTITDAEGSKTRYTGNALAGQTLTVMGSSFTLHLTSDEDGSDYGFSIVAIEPLTAEEIPDSGVFATETLSDGTLRITDYTGADATVVIPAQINGAQVTEIGARAFDNCTLTSVIIPEGVSVIGDYAFGWTYVKKASLPSTLKILGDGAFNQCDLAEITLPEGLISIGDIAFGGNERLTSFHIPASVTSFGEGIFYDCDDLESFSVAAGNTALKLVDDVLFTANGRTLLLYLPFKTETEYAVPAGVTRIASQAFSQSHDYSDSLTKVTLPEGLTSIGGSAFFCNNLLESINIPSTCTDIGGNAFEQCASLKEITLPEGIDHIDWAMFSSCTSLETVVLPQSIVTIDRAFAGCTSLKSINLPEDIESISSDAFSGCTNMQASVVSGTYAEQWCINNGVSYTIVPSPTVALIESEHPYAPNTEQTWEYVSEGDDVYAQLVTFSRRTYFGNNDYLIVTDGNGYQTNYWNSSLKGKTICVPGSSFTLTLHSNEDEGEYNVGFGFMVTEIVPLTEEEFLNYGEFTYYTQSDGTAAITGFTGFLPNLVIPAEIDGYPVTTINNEAFCNNPHLVSVVIPEGVTKIESFAFYNCNSLTSVSLPEGLTEISNEAFAHCNLLTSIDLPSTLTVIGSNAFYCCYQLTGITLPDGVTAIGSHAFANCHQLEVANLPSSLTFIDDSAFDNCRQLYIHAPEGSYAWLWAEEKGLLPEVALIESEHPYAPNSELSWTHTAEGEGTHALLLTFSRKTYFGNGDWLIITDGNGTVKSYSYADLQNRTICVPGSSFTLTLHSNEDEGEYNVGFGFMVTAIEPMSEEEFLNYGEFTYYTQEDGTLAINGYTGFNPNLVIPAEIDGLAVTVIGGSAFNNNDYLVSVVIPEGVTIIEGHAFANCDNLSSITLPEGLTSIADYAFGWNRNLTDVNLPSTLTTIGEGVFYDCGSLTEVVVPEGVTEIGSSVFSECYALTSVTLPEGLTSIADYAFGWNWNLTDVNLPSTLTAIGDYAFYNCNSLTEITIPEGVTEIASYTFSDCHQLETVNLPASLTFIDDSAFNNCSKLTITAPEGSYAWLWAEEKGLLPEVAIIESEHPYAPNTEQSWEYASDNEDTYAHLITFSRHTYFGNGDWLSITDSSGAVKSYSYVDLQNRTICVPGSSFTLTLHSNEDEGEYNVGFGFMVTAIEPMSEEEFLNYGEFTYYTQEDGTLAINDYTGFKPNLVIPAEIDGLAVTAIGGSAFNDDDYLESIVIPEGVTIIEGYAFANCDNLSSITLPEGLTSIADYAFGWNRNLTDVNLPSTLTLIGEGAFYNCDSLTEIAIPEGMTEITNQAFGSCSNLASISLPSTLTTIGESAFNYAETLTEIVIPEGVTEIGTYAFDSCYNLANVSLPSTLTTIGSGAFYYCGSLTEIVIPEGVTTIDQSAFYNCDSLTEIVIPEGITEITNQAFDSCSNLASISLPSTLTTIGQSAFYNCYSLTEIVIPEGVTTIGQSAFADCYDLETVNLPASLTFIDDSAFNNCSQLYIHAPEGSYAWLWAEERNLLPE